jgi:eukaryotic-like serine/threonine-protein kinase
MDAMVQRPGDGAVAKPEAAEPDTSARWARVKALFHQAVDLPDGEQSEFLARACGADSALRQDVESLLGSDRAAGAFAETPAAALLGGAWLEARPRLQPGASVGPYEVTAFIGAGGMGEVYRARHRQLRREVAIKTVASGLHDPTAGLRLLKEAQHASKLSHPNICRVYEIGEAGDLPFIVMEYVDGRPLDRLLAERLPSIEEALAYGIQVADALEHAHACGIVHRDLKSSNVVVGAKGEAVVLDFGLARRLPGSELAHSAALTEATQPGLAGTVSHMAPEVLRGVRADTRSDVWALGVMLYELVTGTLPFPGRTAFETSSAIQGEPPRPLPRRVPLALRLVIERCLIKDPNGRYQRAADAREALDGVKRRRRWPVLTALLALRRRRLLHAAALAASLVVVVAGVLAGARALWPTAPPPTPTIAIVPLAGAAGDTPDYYAEGMTDALIAQLGTLPAVRVLSREAAGRLAGGGMAVPELAAELGATAVLAGSLARTGDRIRLDLRLLEPREGRVIWSEAYDRSTRDVLVLQADAVRAVALQIEVTLQPHESRRLAAVRTISPEVYETFLQGRYHWNQRTVDSLQRAVEQFTRAVELDPTYAPAHAALADCYNQLGTVLVGGGPPREYRAKAAAAVIRALQMDPELAEAHATLGYVRHYEWRWEEAERALRHAIYLNPSLPLARVWYANLLMSRERFEEALVQVFTARDLDPFSAIVNTNVGWVLHVAGRVEEAAEHLRLTVDLDPGYVQARVRLAGALSLLGRHDEALAEAERVVALTGPSPGSLLHVAQVDARAGRREKARAALEQILGTPGGYVPAGAVVNTFLALDDRAAAVEWLERAFEERSNRIAYLLVDEGREALSGDPRFEALLERAGFR